MTSNWQDAATAVILLMAIGYVAYYVVQRIRRKGSSACGGDCSKCAAEPPEKRLVKLDEPPHK